MNEFVCRCPCCETEVTPGQLYCPNCLITLLKPSEEVIDNGSDNNKGSDL